MSLDELQELMKMRAGLVKTPRKPGTKRPFNGDKVYKINKVFTSSFTK